MAERLDDSLSDSSEEEPVVTKEQSPQKTSEWPEAVHKELTELAKTPPRRTRFVVADSGAAALIAWRNDLPGWCSSSSSSSSEAVQNGTGSSSGGGESIGCIGIAAEELLAGHVGVPKSLFPEAARAAAAVPAHINKEEEAGPLSAVATTTTSSTALYCIYTSGSTGRPKAVVVDLSQAELDKMGARLWWRVMWKKHGEYKRKYAAHAQELKDWLAEHLTGIEKAADKAEGINVGG